MSVKISEDWLYPEIEANRSEHLKVSDIHEIYVEECGNPNGKPVVFIHGGPGGGASAAYRRFFNPEKYRIILFDQRGCGRSKPHSELEENTTWALVEDIEKIRQHLNIKKWQVFGGSWGSTLALTYAISHPNSVSELVLRGIFMLRKKELDWFYQEGASRLFPDAWQPYYEFIPEAERNDFIKAYYKRLTGPDTSQRKEAAKRWSVWEASTSCLIPNPKMIEEVGEDHFADAFARIESHYFVNKGFFESEDFILKNVEQIRSIPGVIVQGRYDVVCPAESAYELHRAWPESDLVVVPDAGHSAFEKGIARALVAATDRFAERSH